MCILRIQKKRGLLLYKMLAQYVNVNFRLGQKCSFQHNIQYKSNI